MSEFDCGNRTADCDNATICPCLNFINKETRSYSELLHSSLFREVTKEERKSVDNYIKSISKKLHTFTDDQLVEHNKQIRAEAIDKFMKVLCEDCKKQPCYGDECYQKKIAEQLKKEV